LHLDLHSAQDHLKGHAGKRFAATWPRKTKSFVLAAASLKLVAEIAQLPHSQLWLILGDGVNQAADLVSGATSIPSRNLTPLMTFGN
jgi:hypothetical protein